MLLGYNSAHTASTVAIASKSSSCAANAAFLTPTRSTFILAHTRRTRGRALRQRVWNTLSTLARSKLTPRVLSGTPLRQLPATSWSAHYQENMGEHRTCYYMVRMVVILSEWKFFEHKYAIPPE